jgi:hypothetical protein
MRILIVVFMLMMLTFGCAQESVRVVYADDVPNVDTEVVDTQPDTVIDDGDNDTFIPDAFQTDDILLTDGDSAVEDGVLPDELLQDEVVTDDVPDEVTSFCGDNTVNGSEVCDGNEIDCTILNSTKYTSGVASCNNGCTGFDESTCVVASNSAVDPNTGLVWALDLYVGPWDPNNPTQTTNLFYYPKYCNDLVMDNRDDWRLPTVDEARSLIVGCYYTKPTGTCDIHDDCFGDECYSDVCKGCDYTGTPYTNTAMWRGSITAIWTSTVVTGKYNWVVDYEEASITKIDTEIRVMPTWTGFRRTIKCVAGSMK